MLPFPSLSLTPPAGKVTHSIVYNNATLATVTENTMKDVENPGFAVFPTGERQFD